MATRTDSPLANWCWPKGLYSGNQVSDNPWTYLQITERVACVSIFSRTLYKDLPTEVGLFPTQYEEGEGAWLQLVFIKWEVLDDHGLLISAGELESGVS